MTGTVNISANLLQRDRHLVRVGADQDILKIIPELARRSI